MLLYDQSANVEIICTDDAGCCAFVAVSDLPAAGFVVLPRRAFRRVKDGVAAVFADVRWEKGALHPGVGRASVEVEFDYLRCRADTDFGDV